MNSSEHRGKIKCPKKRIKILGAKGHLKIIWTGNSNSKKKNVIEKPNGRRIKSRGNLFKEQETE